MCSGAKIKIPPPPPPSSTKKMGLVPKSGSSKVANNNNNPSSSSAASTKKISNSVQPRQVQRSNSDNSAESGNTPAFNGAKFDKSGYCLKHPAIQLANPMKDDNGKLIYQEIKVTCPSCQTSKYKAKKNTSLGGGKVRTGHRVHGAPSPSSRSRSKSREPATQRSGSERSRSKSTSRSQSHHGHRSSSKSRERSSNNPNNSSSSSSSSNANKPHQRHYETPFDSKGRCHYHKNVQLAAKKMTGGWKMLHSACPKCMEDKYTCGDVSDDRSVKSNSSRRSLHRADTHGSGSTGGGGGGGADAAGSGSAATAVGTQFDKNGCCVLHTHVQVAKKRVFGTGYKVVRACPACAGADVTADDMSVSSKKSTRSTSSRKSTRSVRSSASRGASGGSGSSKPGKASKSGRYGALPFDGDGYCCRHPNVQLAKKKALGGYKIIHDVCPDCADEDVDNRSIRSRGSSRSGGGRNRSRSKSASRGGGGTGRVYDEEGSVTSSSVKSSGSNKNKKKKKKKRIRVRNLKTQDEEGKAGRYSGDVNDDHLPHGNGVMSYTDGSIFEGVWNEGSKVCGKTKK